VTKHIVVHETSPIPLPPADFNARSVPIYPVNLAAVDVMRIHRTELGPIYYSKRTGARPMSRYDPPVDEFGVMYAAMSFNTCMAETLIRESCHGAGNIILEEDEVEARSLTTLGTTQSGPLRLADFTRDFFSYGMDNRVNTTTDYAIPNQWSIAAFHHPAMFDGIYFPSRFTGEPVVALFSDRAPISVRKTVPLISAPELGVFLNQYGALLRP
jgi:hypothetical protein